MLDKFTVHLKNIIFFKAVLYTTVIIGLFLLIPTLKEKLSHTTDKKYKAQAFLNAATVKLDSIIDFENKITKIKKDYTDLKNKANLSLRCKYKPLVDDIKKLSNKYNLFSDIDIKIAQTNNKTRVPNTNNHIKLKYYNMRIKFRIDNYSSLLMILEDISSLLPKGSIIEESYIKKIDVLTPDIINSLNSSQPPDLINVRLYIKLREIIYET